MDEHTRLNKETWDTWAEYHAISQFYDVEGFLEGGNRLKRLEREALGEVSGFSLLHLQCHFGLDTMSWARLGAVATGVDFSPKAISLARSIAERADLDVRFIESSIEDLADNPIGEFDIVFTSYGVLCWLRDLQAWAKVIASHLKPGGRFFIADGHPTACMFDNADDVIDWRIKYPYFYKDKPIIESFEGSYATADSPERATAEWSHGLGEIVNVLIGAGLTIQHLEELPYSFYRCSPLVEKRDDGNWWPIDSTANIPLTFAILATKNS